MTPEQFKQMMELMQKMGEARAAGGFDWLQGTIALGATVVSVTGVVVGMRSAISSMGVQLQNQSSAVDHLREEISAMSKLLAVVQYAMGIADKELNKGDR